MNSPIKSFLKRKCSNLFQNKDISHQIVLHLSQRKNKKRAEVLLRNSVRKICLSVKPTKEVLSGL